MPDLLLAIKQRHAEDILFNNKTVEIRKRCPRMTAGDKVYLYVTAPISAVVGYFIWDGYSVHGVQGFHVSNGVNELAAKACLTVGELFEYIENSKGQFYSWHIKDPVVFGTRYPVYGDNPPQSYRFLKRGEKYE